MEHSLCFAHKSQMELRKKKKHVTWCLNYKTNRHKETFPCCWMREIKMECSWAELRDELIFHGLVEEHEDLHLRLPFPLPCFAFRDSLSAARDPPILMHLLPFVVCLYVLNETPEPWESSSSSSKIHVEIMTIVTQRVMRSLGSEGW